MDFYAYMEQVGVDTEKTLQRFSGNEALWKRFLKKFPADRTFSQLQDAMGRKDAKAIENEAHTLKGACANLGFDRLSGCCAQLVNCMRSGGDPEELYAAVEREYKDVCNALDQCDL